MRLIGFASVMLFLVGGLDLATALVHPSGWLIALTAALLMSAAGLIRRFGPMSVALGVLAAGIQLVLVAHRVSSEMPELADESAQMLREVGRNLVVALAMVAFFAACRLVPLASNSGGSKGEAHAA